MCLQLRRATRALALAAALVPLGAGPAPAFFIEEQTVGSLIRYFDDSARIGVRSIMGEYALTLDQGRALSLHWNHERVRVPAIDAPVGSPEAVDAITTASRPIAGDAYRDFLKVRNELQGELSQGPASLNYYYSSESDYLAQQLGGRVHKGFMDDQLDLAVGASYGWDAIDPLADDDTPGGSDTKTTLHANLVATRVLTPTTLVRAGVEVNQVEGLQHNPYRHVYAGGTHVAERHPDQRLRRDAFVRVHQYLHNRSSVKLGYRWYGDDWGIASHEVGSKLSQYVTRGLYAQYEYRWYTQGPAEFYRDLYASTTGVDGYLSGDYRMATLSSHLFGVSLHLDLATLAAEHPMLGRLALRLDYQRYFNSNNYSANILETGLDVRF